MLCEASAGECWGIFTCVIVLEVQLWGSGSLSHSGNSTRSGRGHVAHGHVAEAPYKANVMVVDPTAVCHVTSTLQ